MTSPPAAIMAATSAWCPACAAIDRLAAAVDHRSMAPSPRLSTLLAVALVALLPACGAAAQKPPPAVEIPAAPPSKSAEDMDDVILAPTQPRPPKPSSSRPTALPGSSIRSEGGDGSSLASAIVIVGAKGESDGVDAEYQYLDMIYGPRPDGWTMIQQSLLGTRARASTRWRSSAEANGRLSISTSRRISGKF